MKLNKFLPYNLVFVIVFISLCFSQSKDDIEIINAYIQNEINKQINTLREWETVEEDTLNRRYHLVDFNKDGNTDIIVYFDCAGIGGNNYWHNYYVILFEKVNSLLYAYNAEWIHSVHDWEVEIDPPDLHSNNRMVIDFVLIESPNKKKYLSNTYDIDFKNRKISFNKYPNYKRIGEPLEIGYFIYTVTNIEFRKVVGNNFLSKVADGIYLVVDLSILNSTREPRTITNGMFSIYTSSGIEYSEAHDAVMYLSLINKDPIVFNDVPPNIPKKFSLIYEVPDESEQYFLSVTGGFWSAEEKLIWLK